MRRQKPTVEEIKELVKKCEKHYSQLWERFAEDEEFYELEFKNKLQVPKQFAADRIVLPTGRDAVDGFVDNIDLTNAAISTSKHGESKQAELDNDMMRRFYTGVLYRNMVEADISPVRVAGKHYALHGMSVLKTIWDADRWFDKPEREDGMSDSDYAELVDQWRADMHDSIPIVILAIHPRNIMPDPAYGGRLYVIERHERLVFDAQRIWPRWKNLQKKGTDDTVEYISYWDKDYRCDLVDDEPILKAPGGVDHHRYGFIPYTIIETGLGNLSADAKPEKRYVGILRYMKDLLVSESQNFSVRDVILSREAWKGGYITGEGGANLLGKDGTLNQEYGKYTWLPPGVQVNSWEMKIPPDALNYHLADESDRIAAHASPRVLRGLGDAGLRSAAQERFRAGQAGIRYQYATEAFKHRMSKVMTNCARIMKNVVPGDMPIWAKTPMDEFEMDIKKDRMKEPFTCYIEYRPTSEEDDYRKHDDLERMVTAGLVTRKWARKQMANVDPKAMETEELKERIKALPAVLQVIDQAVALQVQQALQALGVTPPPAPAAPGAPPGGEQQEAEPGRRLVPPIPERAPIGSAGDMQNQMRNMRSQTPMNPNQGRGGGGNRP